MTKSLRRNTLIGYKLFFGLLGFSALVTEIAVLIERGVFNPVNFFSFFTVQTNILVSATLLLSAILLALGKGSKLDTFRSAVTVYILVVGIGFAALLANIEGIALTAVPWDNTVLHYIIPVAMLGDLLLDRPTKKLAFRRSLKWLLYPLIYVIYSLTRGAMTGWYPYPFLDPATKGYEGIAVVVVGLLVLSVILIWLATRFSAASKKQ